MPQRSRTAHPATVSLSVEVGGACVSVDGVPWADAERVLIALVEIGERVRAQCPTLRGVVEVVPGGFPVTVTEEGGARRVGF